MHKTAAQILGLRITKTTISVERPKGSESSSDDFPFEEFFESLPEMLEEKPEKEKEEKEEDDEDKEASCKEHGDKAVTVESRDGKKTVCPHCNVSLSEKDIYTDAKNWQFCRPCFRKGRGAIRITKQANAGVFGFEYELPPDPDIFDVQKIAAVRGHPYPGNYPNYLESKPRYPGKDYGTEMIDSSIRAGVIPMPDVIPDDVGRYVPYAMPGVGAASGYMLTDDQDEKEGYTGANILKGLATGSGAALGTVAGSKLSGGDTGSAIGGAMGGGLLAYLLAKALIG